jgi:metal-responsive CopG/Arc/MetJ family transcriptional regulator
MNMRSDNKGIRLPDELAAEMDRMIGKHGYRSRAEVAKTAIREFLAKYANAEA